MADLILNKGISAKGYVAPAASASVRPEVGIDAPRLALPSKPVAGDANQVKCTYTVKSGDTLSAIAKRFKVSAKELLALNPQLAAGKNRSADGSRLYPHDEIRIPNAKDPLGQLLEVKPAAAEPPALPKASALPAAPAPLSAPALPSAPAPSKAPALPKAPALSKAPALPAAPSLAPQPSQTAPAPSAGAAAKREIVALDDQALGLASPQEKAALLRNLLWENRATLPEQKKALAILAKAKEQGQLDETLNALGRMNDATHSMQLAFPVVLSLNNRWAYKNLIADSHAEDFKIAVRLSV